MQNYVRPILVLLTAFSPASLLLGESLETHSNEVADGTIFVAADDPDRSDWDHVLGFEPDDDFSDFYPVDIDQVQMAHDSTHLYIRIQALEWDVEEIWRIGTYIDTDQDITTGYTGDFLPVGADHFLEDALAFEFSAETQTDWEWTQTGETVRHQTADMLDVEIAVSRLDIGNPTEFDFILFANNFCCDFQMPDDIYPSEPGGVFTYEFGEAVVEPVAGDCNGDGSIDAADLACVSSVSDRDVILEGLGTLPGDLDGNGSVEFSDFLVLSANFASDLTSYADGNIDLTDGIAFADFLILSANFGQSFGAVPVPEPASWQFVFVSGLAFLPARRNRG